MVLNGGWGMSAVCMQDWGFWALHEGWREVFGLCAGCGGSGLCLEDAGMSGVCMEDGGMSRKCMEDGAF